jgi:hypothetical protein
MSTIKEIRRSLDVNLYQRLLKVLGEYSANTPCTGVDALFSAVVEQGKKVLPKDKKALEILDWILSSGTTARIIHKLLNLRFSDLPVECKPITKNGRKHLVAHFGRDGKISDRIKDIVDWENTGKTGRWVDIDGEAVSLLSIQKEEK